MQIYAFKMATPVVFALAVFLAVNISIFFKRPLTTHDGCTNAIGQVFVLFYIAQTVATLEPFNCFEHPNGEAFWVPAIPIDSDQTPSVVGM